MPASPQELLRMYRTMVLVRQAEERLVKLFAEGGMPGFIHSYIGEEATAVGVCAALRPDDYLTSTHRGHGHILAKGGDLERFFAELYGRASGYCHGKGGSIAKLLGQRAPPEAARSHQALEHEQVHA